jgi:signal transduction histidine kinase
MWFERRDQNNPTSVPIMDKPESDSPLFWDAKAYLERQRGSNLRLTNPELLMEQGTDNPNLGRGAGIESAEARLMAFSTLGHQLCSARTQSDAIRIILGVADNFFGWDACTFDSYSAKDDLVRAIIVVDRIGEERRDFEPVVKHQKPTSRMRQVIDHGALLILREAPVAMPTDAVPMGDRSRPSASLMYVPVRSCDQVIGLLSIQSYSLNAYTSDDLNLMQALADHAAGALDRIQAEEKIKELNYELEDRIAERTAALVATVGELEAFSYSVSHDMRAPLRAMQGYAQILLEDYSGKVLDETATEYLARIARAAVRMDGFIQDVLTYARVLQGSAILQPINPTALIRDLLAAHPEWEPPATKIEIIEPLPNVMGNEALFTQCASHLLSNATRFVAKDVIPQVKIRAEIRGEESRFWFEDNGLGIEPQHSERIFRMFERLHPSSEVEGSGIGLTIVRKAVERMNGTVGFQSQPGQGAKFWIQLPLAR